MYKIERSYAFSSRRLRSVGHGISSISKVTVPPRSLSDLPATRPQLRGRKRNTPLHNTSASRNVELDTSHQTLSCLFARAYHRIQHSHYLF